MKKEISEINKPLYNALCESIEEANRFIEKARKAKSTLINDKYAALGCKDTGSVKRASMDLTRSLVLIRNPTRKQLS